MDDAEVECTYCGEQYHGLCTRCHRAGVPYSYKGQTFNGLCASRGERLCRACRDTRMETEGVDILVIDGRPQIPTYVYNTVRDRDLVQIWIPPEQRGIDGRDAHGAHSRSRKGKRRG
jgi:hypothetical protein